MYLVARGCLAYYPSRLCPSNALLGYKYSGILLGALECRKGIHLQVKIGLGHQAYFSLCTCEGFLWVVELYELRLGSMTCDCCSCKWNELLRLKEKEGRERSTAHSKVLVHHSITTVHGTSPLSSSYQDLWNARVLYSRAKKINVF